FCSNSFLKVSAVISTEPGGGVGAAFAVEASGVADAFAPGRLADLQAANRRRAAVNRSRDERFIRLVSKSANMKTGARHLNSRATSQARRDAVYGT
ncbi:MAG: hypothetical protein ACJ74T_01990, partial [Pyrinomonadaceae bacterium]